MIKGNNEYKNNKKDDRLKASLKRWVFRSDLKVWGSVQSLMGWGSEFQRVEAATEKAPFSVSRNSSCSKIIGRLSRLVKR